MDKTSLGANDTERQELGRRRTSKLTVLALTLVLCLVCDQLTKAIAYRALAPGPRDMLGGLIRLEYVENKGAFMGLGSALPDTTRMVLLLVLTIVVIGMLAVLAFRADSLDLLQFAGLSLIAAGGCSNLVDRVVNHGSVVDWVSVGIGWLRTGVFNVADLAVVGGGLLFLLSSFRGTRRGQGSEAEDTPDLDG